MNLDPIRERIHQSYQYQEEMLKIAILRAWIVEGWPRNMLFWTALHDIKDPSCDEARDLLSTHGQIVLCRGMKAFLWRGDHLLTWDERTFTAYDDPQFPMPEKGSIYPVDNWSV